MTIKIKRHENGFTHSPLHGFEERAEQTSGWFIGLFGCKRDGKFIKRVWDFFSKIALFHEFYTRKFGGLK